MVYFIQHRLQSTCNIKATRSIAICDQIEEILLHKQLEMHGCIISTVATDALVLKHQAISIHGADGVSVALDQLHKNIWYLHFRFHFMGLANKPETKTTLWKKITHVFKD